MEQTNSIETKYQMSANGITKRWLLNSMSVIIVILLAVAIGFSISVSNFCQSVLKQAVEARASIMQNTMLTLSKEKSQSFEKELRYLVESFKDSDKMEMMAVDQYGNIVLSSKGYISKTAEEMPDYDKAIETGYGQFKGKLKSGEPIYAVTIRCPVYNNQYSAVRYVVSLNAVNAQVTITVLIIVIIGIAILLFVVFSSSYFIKSIVIPVKEIGIAAKKISSGEYDAKIEKKYDDEIGDLCDTINQMADELSKTEKMKNEFLSSVSHELRTPLTAIKGWGETVATSALNDTETIEKGMSVIINETERLQDMVEELLDFSRMQNGKFSLVMQKLDILAELEDAIIMYTPKAKRENIALTYELPEKVLYVMGDKNRLRQVFINIIDNAIKYSERGGAVFVSASCINTNLYITIKDNGCGISKDDLPKVKTKFYKANYTKRGSGIGLAVADEIVSLHGGSLDILSEINKGTTVVIKLPVLNSNHNHK